MFSCRCYYPGYSGGGRYKGKICDSRDSMLHLVTSYLISRYGGSYIYARPLLCNTILVPHLMFNFMLGGMAARHNFFETIGGKLKAVKPVVVNCICLGVFVLVSISCIFKYNYFYAFLFISCALFCITPNG